MKKRIFLFLALLLAAALILPAAAEAPAAAAHQFMSPDYFTTVFNLAIPKTADTLSANGTLTEADAEDLKNNYIFTQMDVQEFTMEPGGTVLYFGNDDWSMEAAFLYTCGADEVDSAEPALIMNLSFRAGVPNLYMVIGRSIMRAQVAGSYEDEDVKQSIQDWFKNASETGDSLELPDGCSLSMMATEEQRSYSFLPPADRNPFAAAAEE